MLSDYKTPAEKEFSRGFEAKLEPAVNYLNQCRPVSVSMTNALKHIKWHLTQLPNNITDAEVILLFTLTRGAGGRISPFLNFNRSMAKSSLNKTIGPLCGCSG